ncbi:hypothetical protein KIN20_023288 [Parelaphostrongylus tenuis]|uniref:Uncharacterized protein n=1 Tax=Parelaphostrongylus tenuis TaxID=148309 RepID=A0AAD5MRE7_PARTN|nr:hypothetical protein KIN20_023288 [Parelaphostrongylus tenuis]
MAENQFAHQSVHLQQCSEEMEQLVAKVGKAQKCRGHSFLYRIQSYVLIAHTPKWMWYQSDAFSVK